MAAGNSVVTPVLELLPKLKNGDGEYMTEPFLACCRLIIPIIEKFGTAMSVIKTDISGNISRLEKSYSKDREGFALLYEFVRREVATGKPLDPYGNTSALFWLLRAVDFLVEMVDGLEVNTTWSVSQAATTAYNERLKKYHGWLTQQAFAVVLKFCPERSYFYQQLGDDSVHSELLEFVKECRPVVAEIDEYLANNGAHSLSAS
eukprot:TRINITY_DN30946_c0_g1_i1.p1 TRINITY_DN30946_c0_g1~~TRINITY_DN30946_c0_g1_i1.p1  ORF type:complete len:204 (+),score=30.88 TRINITY_DN30946_c0_g1_i1:357-968(+)